MTKITYIHGIPLDERTQRSANITAAPKVPGASLTSGELRAFLKYRELQLLEQYMPEKAKVIAVAKERIEKALYGGLHRGGAAQANYGVIPSEVLPYVSFLRNAAARNKPAQAGTMVGRSGKIGEIFVPLRDCYIVTVPEVPEAGIPEQGYYDPECMQKNALTTILNNHLEGGSQHLLYNWIPKGESGNGSAYVKAVSHRTAVEVIARQCFYQPDDMAEWMRVAIRYNNAKNGKELGPAQPEENIQLLKNNPDYHVGNPLIIALMPLFLAAIKLANDIVTGINERRKIELRTTLTGIGTKAYGPDDGDFPKIITDTGGGGTDGGTSAGMDTNTMLLIGGGLLAALALSEK